MNMKALVFNDDRRLELQDVPKPKIVFDDDVIIRIKATGICGTDIHILRKEYFAKTGIILGHESSGIVEEIGSRVKNVKPGDHVILDPTYHCGICFYCQNDRPNYCQEKHRTETGVSHNGTFAEYHLVNADFLHPLPGEISFEEATLSEPLGCTLNALRQTRIRSEFRVLVIGAGPMALLFGISTSTMGCEVTIGDIDSYRIEQAQTLFDDVQDYSKKDLLEINENRRFDLIVDTSGRLLGPLLKLIDRGGDILMIGLDYSFEEKIQPSYLTDNGIRIIGSIDTNRTFAPAIKMLSRVKDFKKIITHTYPIDQFVEAFEVLGLNLETGERGEIKGNKVVIQP